FRRVLFRSYELKVAFAAFAYQSCSSRSMRWAGRTSRGAGALGAPGDGIDLVYRRGWSRAVHLSALHYARRRRVVTNLTAASGVDSTKHRTQPPNNHTTRAVLEAIAPAQ